jgi:hypothetical protein
MKLKSVTDYKTSGVAQAKAKGTQAVIEAAAKRFINGDLREAIEAKFEEAKLSDRKLSVNVQVPQEAYQDMRLFVDECSKLLNPLGYDRVAESHDGAGQYGTLFVEWKL